jgi:DNA-binding transcriptional LysR family regulator
MPSNTIEALIQCQKGMSVNLTRIRYFLAVAGSGTVTAAAARLRVAQPAISRQLQRLERELGVVLFEHQGRNLRLTAAGRAFVPLAEEFSVREQHFENALRDLAAGAAQHLVLAAPETSISEIVAPFIATLTPADPLIRVRRESPGQLHAALRDGADLVISTEPPVNALSWLPVAEVQLYACTGPAHEWALAGRTQVSPADLVTQDLLLLPGSYMTRTLLDQAVTRAGLGYGHIEECPVSPVIQAQAAAGFGVGVLTERPRFGVHTALVAEQGAPILLRLHAAWDPAHYAAPLIERLVRRMSAHATAAA